MKERKRRKQTKYILALRAAKLRHVSQVATHTNFSNDYYSNHQAKFESLANHASESELNYFHTQN